MYCWVGKNPSGSKMYKTNSRAARNRSKIKSSQNTGTHDEGSTGLSENDRGQENQQWGGKDPERKKIIGGPEGCGQKRPAHERVGWGGGGDEKRQDKLKLHDRT